MEDNHEHKQTGDSAKSFAGLALTAQIVFVFLFGMNFTYRNAGANDAIHIDDVAKQYGLYQDVHVMIFIGFGFLMTFLKKYSFSSVGYNFLVAALTIQWSIIVHGWVHMAHDSLDEVPIDAKSLIAGDFAAGAILISFGAVLGRISPTHLLAMALFEVVFYAINEYIGVKHLEAVDMGGSIFVHTWGAYFGLGVSFMLPAPNHQERNCSSYQSDMFAMIGTIFLWMFWPSFNGALAPLAYFQRERVVVNTVIALCGSCISAFAASRYFTEAQKFDMVHIQNATLAGGVAVGSSSDLVIEPWGAALIGIIAGTISVLGYIHLSPYLEKKFGLVDVCGIHNLHGVPGIMGGVGGAISALAAGDSKYGANVASIFPARDHRSASEQGGYQLLALIITLGVSVFSGMTFGYISTCLARETEEFHDMSHWELPEDEEHQDQPAEKALLMENVDEPVVDVLVS